MEIELDTFRTNTGTLNERIQRATGLPGVDAIVEQMGRRAQNRATDLLIESPCNESCTTCFFQEAGGPGKIRLTPDVVDDIRTTAKVLGDPDPKQFTLYPKEITAAMSLLPIFSERSITRTLTNGKRLGESGVVPALQQAGITDLMVTVPGDVSAYASYTQEKPETYERLLANIQLAIRSGLIVGVFYPVFRANVDDVGVVVKNLNNLGVSEIKFLRVIPVGRAMNLPDDMFLTREDTIRFLMNVNEARNRVRGDMKLSLFGGSFGPNFYSKSIYRYLAGQTGRWPDSQFLCPMIGRQFVGISYSSDKAYPCFKAMSFPELQIGNFRDGEISFSSPPLTPESLQDNLRGQCAKYACQYQPLCLGGCRIAAFSFAKRRGEKDPLFAGQDICVTRILDDVVNKTTSTEGDQI